MYIYERALRGDDCLEHLELGCQAKGVLEANGYTTVEKVYAALNDPDELAELAKAIFRNVEEIRPTYDHYDGSERIDPFVAVMLRSYANCYDDLIRLKACLKKE